MVLFKRVLKHFYCVSRNICPKGVLKLKKKVKTFLKHFYGAFFDKKDKKNYSTT